MEVDIKVIASQTVNIQDESLEVLRGKGSSTTAA